MSVRPLEAQDLPRLLELLTLQDEHSQFRTMLPESRSVDELEAELGDESPYSEVYPFVLERHERVEAYLSLCNYEGEAFLEGPLLDPDLTAGAALPLAKRVIEVAREGDYGFVEAFVDEENVRARELLEEAGFEAFRTTYIYEMMREDAPPLAPTPFRFQTGGDIEASVYRDLYRDTSDNWATRLSWTDEELIERFSDPNVRLLLAYDGGELAGHLELELFEEEGFAEVAYFGVLPQARGRGLGRALLTRGLKEAFRETEIGLVLARAHDDERPAAHALEHLGFRLSHGVVALTLELG